jgi:hypothetical protein
VNELLVSFMVTVVIIKVTREVQVTSEDMTVLETGPKVRDKGETVHPMTTGSLYRAVRSRV